MIGQAVENGGEKPSLKGSGRSKSGRFVKGEYRGGPGNPNSSKVQKLRHAMLAAVTQEDVKRVARNLIRMATDESADVGAIKEFFDRTLGKATQPIDITSAGEEVTFTLQIGHLNGESPSDN